MINKAKRIFSVVGGVGIVLGIIASAIQISDWFDEGGPDTYSGTANIVIKPHLGSEIQDYSDNKKMLNFLDSHIGKTVFLDIHLDESSSMESGDISCEDIDDSALSDASVDSDLNISYPVPVYVENDVEPDCSSVLIIPIQNISSHGGSGTETSSSSVIGYFLPSRKTFYPGIYTGYILTPTQEP